MQSALLVEGVGSDRNPGSIEEDYQESHSALELRIAYANSSSFYCFLQMSYYFLRFQIHRHRSMSIIYYLLDCALKETLCNQRFPSANLSDKKNQLSYNTYVLM